MSEENMREPEGTGGGKCVRRKKATINFVARLLDERGERPRV
ncbi:MAG TPA: hypothetical protein VGV59_17150 [Pyrinomonadaceae bacterium]|nr:hypothetical protein [Pyrinomonadaceae bacterium]